MRNEKEKEKELSRKFQMQKEQYEGTIQRQLTFIDQVGARRLLISSSVWSELSDVCCICPCSSSMTKRL